MAQTQAVAKQLEQDVHSKPDVIQLPLELHEVRRAFAFGNKILLCLLHYLHNNNNEQLYINTACSGGQQCLLACTVHDVLGSDTRWFCRTPNCRDSRINHMFRNTFPMRDN